MGREAGTGAEPDTGQGLGPAELADGSAQREGPPTQTYDGAQEGPLTQTYDGAQEGPLTETSDGDGAQVGTLTQTDDDGGAQEGPPTETSDGDGAQEGPLTQTSSPALARSPAPSLPPPPPPLPSGPALYVAKTLASFLAPAGPLRRSPEGLPLDEARDDAVFRPLDLAFYAWIEDRMERAEQLLATGRLSAATYEQLRMRLAEVRGFALVHLGGYRALEAARREIDPSGYAAPGVEPEATAADDRRGDGSTRNRRSSTRGGELLSGHLFPRRGEGIERLTEIRPIAAHAVAKVDAIAAEALALGWSHAALYQNRSALAFPFGDAWGLVAFIDRGDELVEVTAQSIGIRARSGRVNRFYRAVASSSSPPPSSSSLPPSSLPSSSSSPSSTSSPSQQQQQEQPPHQAQQPASPQSHPVSEENP